MTDGNGIVRHGRIAMTDRERQLIALAQEAQPTWFYPRGNDGTDGLEDGHWQEQP